MKKVFAMLMAVSVFFSLFSGVTTFAEKQENQYVVNGDFETGDYTGWTSRMKYDGTINDLMKDEETGNYYLRMETAPDSTAVRISSEKINGLQPNDLITLSFDLKIDEMLSENAASSGALVGVAFRDKNGDGIDGLLHWYKYHDVTGDWRHYEIDFLLPETATGLNFQFRLTGGGKVSWDNVKITDGKNKTDLSIEHSGVPLDRVPDGINSVTAKMHYVSETGDAESGNLIFAAYSKGADGKKALAGLSITPFTTSANSDSIFLTSDIALPDNAKDISVKAYIWKNGGTLEPIANSEVLPKKGRSPVYDRFITEKMRGAYGGNDVFSQDDVMDRLLDSGINTIIFLPEKYGDFEWLDQTLADIEKYAIENNLMVFTKANYSSNRVIPNDTYGAYHPGREHNYTGPCPLAKGYWEKAMYEPLAIAAKYPGITGGIFDMEMYQAGGKLTHYHDPCLCDNCVKHFALDNPSDAATKLTQTEITKRLRFLMENSIRGEYCQWQANELTIIATDLRERLHAINPNYIIGIMPYHSWFPGLDEGLGTEEMPLLIFSEAYSADLGRASFEIAEMKKKNIIGVYTKGIGPRADFVQLPDFKQRVVDASVMGGGYFLYDISYLETDYAAATEETATTYYAELKKANEELDKVLGIKKRY